MRRITANVGLVVVSIMVAILLAEIALRLLGITHPVFMAYDPIRGFSANRPGAKGWFTEEGRAYVTINSAGLRDREHDLEKPPGTIRIAVLGDSYAAALQVESLIFSCREIAHSKSLHLHNMIKPCDQKYCL